MSTKYQIWLNAPTFTVSLDNDAYVTYGYVVSGYVDDYVE